MIIGLLAFLFGGFIHVALYGVAFFDCICQIYYAALVLLWGITIQKRVIDKRIRIRLMSVVLMMVTLFALQMCKYKLFGEDLNALRYVWYSYYVLIMLVPSQLYQVALLVGLKEDERLKKRTFIPVLAVTYLLSLLFLTNDFHQLIFSFPNGLYTGVDDHDLKILFYAMYAWIAVMLITSLIIVVKKSRVLAVKRAAWFPAVIFFLGCMGIILFSLDKLKFQGTNIWLLGELYFFAEVGFEEACICVGLIPTNVGYRKLLGFTRKMIMIKDRDGEEVLKSDMDLKALAEDGNWLMFNEKISGGTVSWAVDMSSVFNLNRQIAKVTEHIEVRNEYLHTQNDLMEEQSKINARNELFDNMAGILKPQIRRIEELLKTENDSDFDENLKEIAVLNAYIKRRSNMELLRDFEGFLPLKELYMAIAESCEYIKLCGVETYVAPSPEAKIAAETVILLYEFFEFVVEKYLTSLKTLLVSVNFSAKRTELRLRTNVKGIKKDDDWHKAEMDEFCGAYSITEEEDDVIVMLSLKNGGAAND